MILNRQGEYAVDLSALRAYVRRLKRALRLTRREFNLCLVGDREIARLNAAYRSKPRPTDVLSFPWTHLGPPHPALAGHPLPRGEGVGARRGVPLQDGEGLRGGELRGFLGDVVISAETARRNARLEGHSTFNEIRWLALHGLLHLLGYDHERDHGEMTWLELALRERLGIAGRPAARRRHLKKRAKGPHG